MLFISILQNSVVLVIVDGMGPQHQQLAKYAIYGPNGTSPFDTFQYQKAISTQNVLHQLTDSAAASTAFSTGTKTINENLGLDQNFLNISNILEYLRNEKPNTLTGIVSKIHSAHATPAGFMSHVQGRYDYQAVYNSIYKYNKADLIFGAGDTDEYFNKQTNVKFKKLGYNIITTNDYEQDNKILEKTALPIIAAVTNEEYLSWFIDVDKNTHKHEPNLTYLSQVAINKLSKNGNDFFLMIECSLVDYGGHANNKSQVVGDMAEAFILMNELKKLQEQLNFSIIVTADHETGALSIADDLQKLKEQEQQQRLTDLTKMIRNLSDSNIELFNNLLNQSVNDIVVDFGCVKHSNSYVSFNVELSRNFDQQNVNKVLKQIKYTSDIRRFIEMLLNNDINENYQVQNNFLHITENNYKTVTDRMKYYYDQKDINKGFIILSIILVVILILVTLFLAYMCFQFKQKNNNRRKNNVNIVNDALVVSDENRNDLLY